MHVIKRFVFFLFSVGIIGYSLFSLIKIIKTFAADFSVYYHAGLHALHGQSLYTNISFTLFAYPPISSFVYVPFTIFPYQIAQGIFLCVSYLCVFISVLLVFALLKQRPPLVWYFVTVSLMLVSFPTKFTLGMGQSNLIALALFIGSVLLDQKNKKVLAGVLFAFAIMFKPILGFCILYFLWKKSWKTILACMITGISLAMLQILLLPKTLVAWQEYVTQVLPGLFTSKGREVYYNQGLLGTTARLVNDGTMRTVISLIGSAIFLGAILTKSMSTRRDSFLILALLLCVLPLIDGLSWQHHFVILLFPMLYAFSEFQDNKSLLCLLGLSYLLISYNIKSPQQFLHFPLNLVISHVFFGAILLFTILLYGSYRKRQKGSAIKL